MQMMAEEVGEQDDSHLSRILSKTKLCTFYQQGRCTREFCTFAHGEHELRARPDLEKTVFCHFLRDRGMCYNVECKFAHSMWELRTDRIDNTAVGDQRFDDRGPYLGHGEVDNHRRIEAAGAQMMQGSPTGARDFANGWPHASAGTTTTWTMGPAMSAMPPRSDVQQQASAWANMPTHPGDYNSNSSFRAQHPSAADYRAWSLRGQRPDFVPQYQDFGGCGNNVTNAGIASRLVGQDARRSWNLPAHAPGSSISGGFCPPVQIPTTSGGNHSGQDCFVGPASVGPQSFERSTGLANEVSPQRAGFTSARPGSPFTLQMQTSAETPCSTGAMFSVPHQDEAVSLQSWSQEPLSSSEPSEHDCERMRFMSSTQASCQDTLPPSQPELHTGSACKFDAKALARKKELEVRRARTWGPYVASPWQGDVFGNLLPQIDYGRHNAHELTDLFSEISAQQLEQARPTLYED